ncbi:MAG TPA: hypothetical protein VN366_10235 [Feifaniaceae bacterium]|nr:hypothetical protein [Feifaniaceae bacterium]
MTQRELEKLLKNPEVLQELEQSLFGDPLLWAPPEEVEAAKSAEELLKQKRLQIKEQAARRVMQEGVAQARRAAPRGHAHRQALQWAAAAVGVAALVCYIAFYPQNASLATSYDEKVARKEENGCVIIESVETPPNVLKSCGMRISGVDGFEMYSYGSIDEYIEKTGRDPVLVTGGYERIAHISDELDPDLGYTLMIAYELPGDRYISTSQFYADDAKEIIFPDGYERTVLNGKTMHCRVEDDSTSTNGSVRLSGGCVFYISVPYEEQLDLYLGGLKFASELSDTSSFFVPPPEPMPEDPGEELQEDGRPRDISYDTFEDLSRDSGYWPMVLKEGFAKPVSIELHRTRATGDMISVLYEKDGLEIVAFQRYGFMDGTVYFLEEETYFTTEVLGDYTFHCSVDLHDGSAAGVGVVKDTAFFIITEKGIDFEETLKNLYIMKPK